MRAAVFHGPGDLRIETVPTPQPGPGEVLIKIAAALTCGTDFKAYRQGHPVLLNNRLPSPFGHEGAGEIAAIGAGVRGFSVGDRVVAANSGPCADCFFCKNAQPNLCDNLELLNGTYAEYLLVPSRIVRSNLHRIPENLDFRTAALAEPLACVVRAFERLQARKGETLVIHGCGLMGLFFVALAKRSGVYVLATGRSREKLALAKTFGADQVISTLDTEAIVETVREMTPGERGADCVVEAIGKAETWQEAVAMARKGGMVCLYGGCAKGASFPLDTHRVHYEELTVFGTFHHTPGHFSTALQFLAEGVVKSNPLIRGIVSLDQLPAHFLSRANQPFEKYAVT